jgi:glyoxalase-like protein
MEIDHVLIAVSDLASADVDFSQRYGLSSVEGGRHPGWGTANRIVPLGATYIEMIAIVDRLEAGSSILGQWVERTPPGELLGWAVRTDRIDQVAARRGLTVSAGSRRTPAGDHLTWRSAGVEQAAAEPTLPFFIQWSEGSRHPATVPLRHAIGQPRLSRLELTGDGRKLAEWLDGAVLPVSVSPGPARLARVQIRTDGHEIAIP